METQKNVSSRWNGYLLVSFRRASEIVDLVRALASMYRYLMNQKDV